MKILVFSDSHGNGMLVDRMILREPDCKEIIFLGDGLEEVEEIKAFHPDRKFTVVKGNNDFEFTKSKEAYKYFDGVTVFACHGDTYDVRSTLYYVFKKAESVMAGLALYGHTHIPKTVTDPSTEITAVNPGALCNGKYCVIEIEKGSFTVNHKSCYND